MKKTEFLKMVELEALHLRNNATDEEKNNLDFNRLNACSSINCIYGQMTGDCRSERAYELYSKEFHHTGANHGLTFTQCFQDGCFKQADAESDMSPIEIYITIEGSKNERLLKYINGEIKTFKA